MTDISTLPDRALSIRQPWAWAILNAGKDIENRPRRFHYRGPICIHASKASGAIEFMQACQDIVAITASKHEPPKLAQPIDRGGIIGTAEIVDCIEASDSPWWIGPFGLVLRNVQPVPFISVKGALGLFKWKRNIDQMGEAQ